MTEAMGFYSTTVAKETLKLISTTHFLCVIIYMTFIYFAHAFIQSDWHRERDDTTKFKTHFNKNATLQS